MKQSLILCSMILASCGGGSEPTAQPGNPNVEKEKPVEITDTKASYSGKGIGTYTSVDFAALTEEQALEGQAIFDSKCLACHEMTDVKKVGPGLAGITQRRTPEWILNMITNPQEMTQKDPMAMKLLEETLSQMTYQDVDDAQAKALLAYFKSADAAQ
jgi:mono/diheme cytochrome c family protein